LRKTLILILLAAGGFAASPPRPFEVASIRPHDPNSPNSTMKFLPGGSLSISGITIKNLIWLAWQLPPERVSGGPKWLDSELYDIQAKPPPGDSSSGQRLIKDEYLRIQALLVDRCNLRIRRETKAAPVYELTIAKNGLKMQEAKGSDPHADDKGSITPWSLFVTELSQRLNRPVIDKTGLSGAWYVKLQYATDDGQPAGMGVRIDRSQPVVGPSIFTAVLEQLGLKLDSAKASVDTLIIESVTRPSPN